MKKLLIIGLLSLAFMPSDVEVKIPYEPRFRIICPQSNFQLYECLYQEDFKLSYGTPPNDDICKPLHPNVPRLGKIIYVNGVPTLDQHPENANKSCPYYPKEAAFVASDIFDYGPSKGSRGMSYYTTWGLMPRADNPKYKY